MANNWSNLLSGQWSDGDDGRREAPEVSGLYEDCGIYGQVGGELPPYGVRRESGEVSGFG